MDRLTYYDNERAAIRQELHNLKSCQNTFLTTAITTTSIMLGITASFMRYSSGSVSAEILLLPLSITIPLWWMFFDKAKTVSRCVGYHRILESLLLKTHFSLNFIGWERALGELRKERDLRKNKYTSDAPIPLYKIVLLLPSNRYWILAYYTYFGLSVLCVSLYLSQFDSYVDVLKHPMFVASIGFLLLLTIFTNIRAIHNLINKENSYDANEKMWNKILQVYRLGAPEDKRKANHPPPNNVERRTDS